MRFYENNSVRSSQNQNPSICPNVLHIVNQWWLFNWWRQLSTTEDWQKDQNGFHPGQWVHTYNSRHQMCPGVLTGSQASWLWAAHRGTANHPGPHSSVSALKLPAGNGLCNVAVLGNCWENGGWHGPEAC